MAICYNCNREIPDNSAFCPCCGAAQNAQPQQPQQPYVQNPYQQPYQPPYQQPYQQPYSPYPQQQAQPSNASVILGIVGIVSAFLLAIVGHVTSIMGIIKGVKDKNTAGLVLSIIGEVCSVISSLVGMLMMSGL